MASRPRPLTALVALALLVATPAAAQDEVTRWLGRALTTGARAPLVAETARSPESAQRALELQAEGA
ncbi:MAG: hypothetical protein ACLGHP_01790, partial [Vicinamibacteria bacterium]